MVESAKRMREISLISGVLSSLLYFCTDIFGGLMWGNYDFATQYISELSAIDAPSRPFTVSLYIVYNILVAVFALGVWNFKSNKRVLRITGSLLMGYVVVGLAGLFFPMDPSGTEATFSNVMHQIFAGVIVVFILLSLGFGGVAFGQGFRFYSIGTILVYLILGALPFMSVVQFEAGQPTPWIGLVERIMVYGFMIWMAMLASVLWHAEKKNGRLESRTPTVLLY